MLVIYFVSCGVDMYMPVMCIVVLCMLLGQCACFVLADLHWFGAVFLCCCVDCPSCPTSVIQMSQAAWATIKKYSPNRNDCEEPKYPDNADVNYNQTFVFTGSERHVSASGC